MSRELRTLFSAARPVNDWLLIEARASACYPGRLRVVVTHWAADEGDAWLHRFVAPDPAAACVRRWLRWFLRRWARGERTDLRDARVGPTNRMPLHPDALVDRVVIHAWIEAVGPAHPLRVDVDRRVPNVAANWKQRCYEVDDAGTCVRDWLAGLPARWDQGERIRHRYPGGVIPDDDPNYGLEALGLTDLLDDLTEDERRAVELEAEQGSRDLLGALDDDKAFARDEFIPDVCEDEEEARGLIAPAPDLSADERRALVRKQMTYGFEDLLERLGIDPESPDIDAELARIADEPDVGEDEEAGR